MLRTVIYGITHNKMIKNNNLCFRANYCVINEVLIAKRSVESVIKMLLTLN